MNNCLNINTLQIKGLGLKYLLTAILASLVLVVLSACQPRDVQVSKNPFCQQPQNTNADCSFVLGEHRIWLSSSDSRMPIEEGVRLTLTSDVPVHQIHGEIRGVSMYMGRLPVVWEQDDDGLWHADVYLGACTDPDMVWELRLSITLDDGLPDRTRQPETLRIAFQSYIPGR